MISAVIPGIALLLLPFIPATPRYLLRTGKAQQAGRSLYWLRNAECIGQVDIELELLEVSIHMRTYSCNTVNLKTKLKFSSYLLLKIERSLEESHIVETSMADILKLDFVKPVAICLSLMVFEQFSGFNAIIFYTGGIFRAAGTSIDSNLSSIVVGVVQVIATVASSVLVDRAGRRILLLISQIVMSVSLLVLGTFFYFKNDLTEQGISVYFKWLPLLCMLVFVVAFSMGIGPLSWTLMGEILPPNVKGMVELIFKYQLRYQVPKLYAIYAIVT